MTYDEDVDVQALEYVSGRLSADANAAFERTLDSSQAARDAVARAVLLLDAMQPSVPTSARSGHLRRAAVVLAALGLAATVVWWVTRPGNGEGPHVDPKLPTDVAEVDAAVSPEWIDVWLELSEETEDELTDDEWSSVEADHALGDLPDEDELPAWMVEALSR